MSTHIKTISNYVFIFCLLLLHICCQRPGNNISRGFYYWKTSFDISTGEVNRMKALQVQKLYTRFFDVNINGSNEAVPVAKFYMDSMLDESIGIIPVVFITNRTMENIPEDKIENLAGNILSLVDKTARANKINYKELQLDCDWTPKTKNKFFRLLEIIRKKTSLSGAILSCTIRLHQVKYYNKTGIPPVDRGMLMFYNMGKIEDTISNSIFNSADASRYVSSIKSYPLTLDIALPVFSWGKQYRQGRLVGLINQVNDSVLRGNKSFISASAGHYRSLEGVFLHGRYLQEGDLVVTETMTPALAKEAAELLQKNLRAGSFTVVLYHWDNFNLSRYENKDFEDIYNYFK